MIRFIFRPEVLRATTSFRDILCSRPCDRYYSRLRCTGADRVLFGSDHARNQATELEKVRTSGISDEEIDRVLCRTAASLYRLPM